MRNEQSCCPQLMSRHFLSYTSAAHLTIYDPAVCVVVPCERLYVVRDAQVYGRVAADVVVPGQSCVVGTEQNGFAEE